MKNKKIVYKNNIQKKFLESKFLNFLNKKYPNVLKDIKFNLSNNNDTFNFLDRNFKLNFKTKSISKFKKFKTVVIIGMGGSILGAEAIYFFLKDKITKKFLFLDNINEDQINKLKEIKNHKKVLFIVISKSGKTIETISNAITLQVFKKKAKNIIIISEKHSPLYSLAKEKKLFHIDHRKYIGGRYSILTEVGMLPAYLMGTNINKFRSNILNHFEKNNKFFLKSSSISLANLLQKSKFKNLIFCNFAPKLDKFLEWNQQLIAESLGKNQKGFLPIVSKSPKDHHSLLQLYLDGPKDKIFYIFSSNIEDKSKIKINSSEKQIKYLQNKNLSEIKDAQKNAFISILKKKDIPFREFKINDFSEDTLGELFSYFMLETAIVGKLLKTNPFDQPAVEQVKISTRKLLV